MTRAATSATVRATPAPLDAPDPCLRTLTRVAMAIALGRLSCGAVDRVAAQDPSEWQRLAVAEQARRAALSR